MNFVVRAGLGLLVAALLTGTATVQLATVAILWAATRRVRGAR